MVMVDDVDACAERLEGLGVPVLSGPADRPWGHRTVHVADPDGFVVEFAAEIPRARGRRTLVVPSGVGGSGGTSGGGSRR